MVVRGVYVGLGVYALGILGYGGLFGEVIDLVDERGRDGRGKSGVGGMSIDVDVTV